MVNLFNFFDLFFKTLYPIIHDLDDEETTYLNNDIEVDVNLEPEIININEDCKCCSCYYQRKIIDFIFGKKQKMN